MVVQGRLHTKFLLDSDPHLLLASIFPLVVIYIVFNISTKVSTSIIFPATFTQLKSPFLLSRKWKEKYINIVFAQRNCILSKDLDLFKYSVSFTQWLFSLHCKILRMSSSTISTPHSHEQNNPWFKPFKILHFNW